MIKNIEVAILNKKYSLTTDESEATLFEAASYVNKSLSEMISKGNVSVEKAAVCMALQLAAEVLKKQEQRQVADEHIKRIITLCEQQ